MPGKLIGGLVGIVGVLWLGIAGAWAMHWWDMDRPAFHLGPCPLCWHIAPGAHTEIAGLKTAFATEQASVHTLQAALDRQNAAVASLASSAQAWQRRSQQAVSEAASANQWRLATAAQIRRETLPADTTAAERCLASETLLRGAAR